LSREIFFFEVEEGEVGYVPDMWFKPQSGVKYNTKVPAYGVGVNVAAVDSHVDLTQFLDEGVRAHEHDLCFVVI
jgi:hypothetical protein